MAATIERRASRAAARRARRAFRSFPSEGVRGIGDVEAAVCRRRRRPLQIIEYGELAGGSVCGLWLATDDRDLVLHAPARSQLHRQQFVLHELAHIVLEGHPDGPEPGMYERWYSRSVFTEEGEIAAELLADLFASLLRTVPQLTPFQRVFA